MQTVDLVWFACGGGHRAAAQALEQAVRAQGCGWAVRKLDLTEVLDPTAVFRRCTGVAPEDVYNKRLASGWTVGLAQELKLLQALIRLSHRALVQRLARHWQRTRPDMVVSLIPNFNRALHDGLALARPGAPFVTVLTDLADHPPHFWVEPGVAQHVVCGTPHAAAQALAAGCPPQRVHRVGGMILRPEFHAPPPPDRAAARAAAGLDAATPVGLVMFGGTGSRSMKRIARLLPDTPLILMCGRNEALARALRALPARSPRIVVGQTAEVARWMRLADFFIGKPGPGSLSEAVQCGLPVIVARNAGTLPQERWNADWVREQQLGIVLPGFAGVRAAVGEITARLPHCRARLEGVANSAHIDLPPLLQSLLAGGRGAGAAAAESRAAPALALPS